MSAPVTLESPDVAAALRTTLQDVSGPAARLDSWTATLVTHHGRRRVVRYGLDAHLPGRTDPQRLDWVGKFYDGDVEARRVADMLVSLAGCEGSRRGAFVVPTLLGYHAARYLIFMTYETGEPVTPAIARGGGVVVEAIGRALAALHAANPPVTVPVVTTPAVVLEHLRPRVTAMAERVPEAGGRGGVVQRAFGRLEGAAPVADRAPAFLHGDFGPAQLLWRGDRVVIFDFDRATRGDPALDLGNLLTQLRRSALRKPGRLGDFATLRTTFLDAYQRRAGCDLGLADRVGWYELATLLRKIYSLFFDTTRHPEPAALERRRTEAVRLLEELGVVGSPGR
ncbi:MAG TPA: phosphotransferase [Gemmatimonadales bacterium]|nr:phosphotransferase [Gemmatimonadales bacterium]